MTEAYSPSAELSRVRSPAAAGGANPSGSGMATDTPAGGAIGQGGTGHAPAAAPIRAAVRGVKKAFGGNPILRGVDLDIPAGSFAVLVGPSGCGKSTLLRLVAGLEQADEGSIVLAGRDVTRLPPRDRDVAMVFQSYALYPHLTVKENLAFGLKMRGAKPGEIEERIREASRVLGLDALLGRLPKQLSGGQRQRVAMGRAIVRRPSIFLFDEPLSNLDAALRTEVRVEIRRLHDRLGATTLYVTHDQVEAMTLADTLYVMNGGYVEQKGTPLEVYERPRTRFVATFLGSPQMNLLDGVVKRGAAGWFAEATAEGQGLRVPLDEPRFGRALEDGRPVTIGLRPHDVAAARDGGSAHAFATFHVEIVEALGFEAFAHGFVRGSGARFVVRLEAAEARHVRPGDQLALVVDAGKVHLFEPSRGLSLAVDDAPGNGSPRIGGDA
jgi:sn-glycerol 3-phosphate transport system ATP-binding protein/multiple sugar transport system ATP-binding protein